MSDGVADAVFQIIRHHIYPDVADAITNELLSGPLAPLLAPVEAIRAAWKETCAGFKNEDACESCRAYADAIRSIGGTP